MLYRSFAIISHLRVDIISILIAVFLDAAANAQPITVQPVSIQMAPGQMASALTVIDQGDHETTFQARAFVWDQQEGTDQLAPTKELLTSPPLGTIQAGAGQVVRLVLRQPPQGREATYRIFLDQIPPPAAGGTVRIAVRLSIPVFAEPTGRAVAHLRWRIERIDQQLNLVAINDGTRHETVSNIALTGQDGRTLKVEADVSPYVLAGATHRWRIFAPGPSPAPGTVWRLTAAGDTGQIEQSVSVAGSP